MTGAGDDAGQDWVHGEDAGGEGEPQPQCEEGDDAEPEPLIAEGSGQLILLANRCDALCRFSSGRCGCRDQRGHIDQLVGRRVAEAVGAALIAHPQGGAVAHLFERHRDAHLLVVDPGLAEEVILVLGAFRQGRLAEGEVVPLEAQAVAIEVVVVGDVEGQQQLIAALFTLDLKGLIDLQKFGFGVGLNAQRAEQIGATGVGRGAAHRCHQQGAEQQQGREQAVERHAVSPLSQSR